MTYWVFSFFSLLVYSSLVGISETVGESNALLYATVALLIFLATYYSSIAITAKRFHDTNRSGFLMLWVLIPIFGILYLFIVCCFLKDHRPNKYGDPPKSIIIPLIKELFSCIPLIPKALWRWILNRVRELGKAFRGEDD